MSEPKLRRYDEFQDVFIYEVAPDRCVNLSGPEVREHGARDILRLLGYQMTASTARLPVLQYGRKVGTLPADFEPWRIRSASFLYEPRHGDFVREGDNWLAAKSLGPGDLECVPGFVAWREPLDDPPKSAHVS